MQSLVSIIIPVYNTEKYLQKCIESVVCQTHSELEIILINDGSTDNSGEICLEWAAKDNRIIYISKKNEGLGATRNVGVNSAKGKYIVFLDSDDWLAEECIGSLYKCMAGGDVDICFSDYYEYDDLTGNIIARISETEASGKMTTEKKEKIIMGQHCMMCAKMYKKTFFTSNKILIPNIIHEDLAIYPIMVLLADYICYCKETLYYYRINRSKSIKTSITNSDYVVSALSACVSMLKQHQLFDKFYKIILRYMIGQRGILLYKYHQCTKMDNFLDMNFKDWRSFRDYRVLLFGSFMSRWAIQRWLTDYSKLGEHQCFTSLISLMSKDKVKWEHFFGSNQFRIEMLKKEYEREAFCLDEKLRGKCDYLFIDFMEERFDIGEISPGNYITISDAFNEVLGKRNISYRTIESGSDEFVKLWEDACLKFVEKLKGIWNADQIVLIESRLSEQYGVYKGENYFAGLEKIRKINKMLEGFEAKFMEQLKGIKFIRSTVFESAQFTGVGETYGCCPWNKNISYYRLVSELIEHNIKTGLQSRKEKLI